MQARAVIAVSLVAVGTVGSIPAVGAGSGADDRPVFTRAARAASGYRSPLPEPVRVMRSFAPPATPYRPGHLGVDLRAVSLEVVRSSGAGIVRFAGPVAGRGVVVVLHADGISTEYEPVQASVRTGVHVRTGTPIGVVRGRHPGCPGVCLHWGARRGEAYLDPLGLLRPLGPVVLLPWSQARG